MIQYPLAIDFAPSYRSDNYYVSPVNRLAFEAITDNQHRLIFLQGNRSCGKTHLAHVFCEHHQGQLLAEAELSQGYENIEFGEGYFAVDNIEFLPLEAQETLFHLYNMIISKDTGGLLVTSKMSPRDIVAHDKTIAGVEAAGLQDWHSRLSGFFYCEIMEQVADDELLAEILNKNFYERQIYLTSHQLNYIIRHADRDLHYLQGIIKKLHFQLLSYPKTKITKTLIKECFEIS